LIVISYIVYNLLREKCGQAAAAFGRFSFFSFFSPLHRAEVVGKLTFEVRGSWATLNGTLLAKAALASYCMDMPKQTKKRPADINQLAHGLVAESTGEQLPTKVQISLLMSALGKKGGKIGGKRRLKTMTAQERSEVARKAAFARWKTRE